MTSTKAQVYRQDIVLHEAANRVRKYTALKHGERHNRPLVVVVTKYDAWSALLPGELDSEPFRAPKQTGIHALDWDRISATSTRVRDLLWRLSPELVSGAEGFAQEVIYVPVSATGCSPLVDSQGAIQGMRPCDIRPVWVEVPMLIALSRWAKGLVPYVTRKAATASPTARK